MVLQDFVACQKCSINIKNYLKELNMAIHFEADLVRHKEMKDYFTVMIPLTYQKVLSLLQDWYNIRALSYILTEIRKKHFFFNSAKKTGMQKYCWPFTFCTSSLITGRAHMVRCSTWLLEVVPTGQCIHVDISSIMLKAFPQMLYLQNTSVFVKQNWWNL